MSTATLLPSERRKRQKARSAAPFVRHANDRPLTPWLPLEHWGAFVRVVSRELKLSPSKAAKYVDRIVVAVQMELSGGKLLLLRDSSQEEADDED